MVRPKINVPDAVDDGMTRFRKKAQSSQWIEHGFLHDKQFSDMIKVIERH